MTNAGGPAEALVDWQIDEAVRNEGLISEGYRSESARYATYEAHSSGYAQLLTSTDGITAHVRLRPVDDHIWLEPGSTAKIYTEEVLNLGDSMYAIVTGLGQLYACGLSIGSTYVDPGSRGAIYLAVTNVSRRTIGIPVGSPIARIQFWRLGQTPQRQHPGHQSRRRIELPLSDPSAVDRDAAQEANDKERISRLEIALVVQTFAMLGLLWYANPATFDRILRFAAGDDLPPAAHFLVPLIAGPVLFFLLRWMWRSVRHPLRQRIRSLAQPPPPPGSH